MFPAVVLTAGLGTRLDPLTRIVAKPAVPVGNRTLVEHVIDWLRQQGVNDLVLNLHHRPETITGALGDGTHLGLRIRYSWEHPILGSAGGPKRALRLLSGESGEPFLIVNGDTLCPIDLAPMITAHQRTAAAVTMAVVPNPSLRRYNGILLDETDRIQGFVPRDPSGAAGTQLKTWHFVGIQVANPDVFDPLADGVPAETTSGARSIPRRRHAARLSGGGQRGPGGKPILARRRGGDAVGRLAGRTACIRRRARRMRRGGPGHPARRILGPAIGAGAGGAAAPGRRDPDRGRRRGLSAVAIRALH
jgi:mannose-1-phosphate guanylyltransferase